MNIQILKAVNGFAATLLSAHSLLTPYHTMPADDKQHTYEWFIFSDVV